MASEAWAQAVGFPLLVLAVLGGIALVIYAAGKAPPPVRRQYKYEPPHFWWYKLTYKPNKVKVDIEKDSKCPHGHTNSDQCPDCCH